MNLFRISMCGLPRYIRHCRILCHADAYSNALFLWVPKKRPVLPVFVGLWLGAFIHTVASICGLCSLRSVARIPGKISKVFCAISRLRMGPLWLARTPNPNLSHKFTYLHSIFFPMLGHRSQLRFRTYLQTHISGF